MIRALQNDLTCYGDEVKFGGGKVIRDGMGQSQVSRDGGAVDTVITNALIVDVTGIYKADVGLKDGFIHSIGKAGNPDTQDKGSDTNSQTKAHTQEEGLSKLSPKA